MDSRQIDEKTGRRRACRHDALRLVLVALAYLLAHQISFFFPDSVKVLMTIWPAGGVGLAALLLCPRRLWPAILMTLFAIGNVANLATGRPFVRSLGFMTANVLESLSGAWCITRWCGQDIRFVRIKEIGALVFVATVLNACTACLGAGTAALTHAEAFASFWLLWWISDGLGILLGAPLIVTLLRAESPIRGIRLARALEWFLFLLVWVVSAWIAFEPRFLRLPPHPYMLVVILAWPAMRFGQRTVSLALFLLAMVAIFSKTVVSGPSIWGGDTPVGRLLDIQVFLGFTGVAGFMLAAGFAETKALLDALHQSEERFRTITTHFPDHVLVQDRELRYTFVLNPQLGLSQEDMIGKTDHGFLLKEDADRLAAVKKQVLGGGNPVHVEIPLTSRAGRTEYFNGYYVPKRSADGTVTGLIGYFRNVTETRRMEQALRENEEKYRNLFNNAEVGMFRSRVDGFEILDLNDKYAEIFGGTREEMMDNPTVDLWADPAERAAMMERLAANGRVSSFECRMRAKDGAVKTCLISARLYPEQGVVEGSILDISERERAEAERLSLEQQLSQSQRLESLGLLAGGIAHDFNNLMAGVYGHIELALEATLDNEAATNLSRAMASMARARDLTRQLLTFAKGGAPVRSVGRLFPLVEESARFALSGGRATCTFDVASDLWACSFDRNQLGQVIDNLIINARQAMPGEGAIRILARNATLGDGEVATLPAGNYVIISVVDSGMGIPPEALPRIFDPFFTTKEQGRGLGLSTCHSIMRRHDGAITAESTPGKGSTFRLYLPAANKPDDVRVRGKSAAGHRGRGRVLVMDDEKVVRDVLAAMLTSLGYAVETASEGRAALELFGRERAVGPPFAAAFLDLTVPGGMDGREAAQGLRALDSGIALFVTSGYADDPAMAEPAAYGFKASLRKPFTRSDVSNLLDRHLGTTV